MTAPVELPRYPAHEVACGLCGHRFLPTADTMSCPSCPMNRRCSVLCCPRCGYEFVTESKVVNFFRRLFRPRRAAHAPAPPPASSRPLS